jgi:hypothetical protein
MVMISSFTISPSGRSVAVAVTQINANSKPLLLLIKTDQQHACVLLTVSVVGLHSARFELLNRSSQHPVEANLLIQS